MCKTGIFLLAVMMLISGGVTFADSATIADAIHAGVRHNAAQLHDKDRMELMLNETLYEIQPESSKMAFRVDSPIGDVWGSFEDFQSSFTMLSRGANDGLASIEINAKSLDADAGFIGMMLKSKRFFDVENFPSMRFVGSSLEWYKDSHAVLKGYLTIKNVSRQVAFYVKLVDVDDDNEVSERIIVEATTTIKRSAFGIDSMVPAVSDNVNLFMSIDAVKKQRTVTMR
jgi:polyisoprenoid-binding protein YceI